MKIEQYLKFGFAGLVWGAMWLLPAGCTIEEGDVPPRPMQVQNDIYSQIMRLNGASKEILYLVVGANEYLLQTTDEERETVRLRFFPWGDINLGEDGLWILSRKYGDYNFVVKDGIPLGATGAVWKVYAPALKGTITTEGKALHCLIGPFDDTSYHAGVVDWLAEVALSDDECRISCLSGTGTLNWSLGYRDAWQVDYRVEEPLVWSDSEQMARGLVSVTARLQDHSGLELQFEARTTPGEVTISCDGVSEKWEY